MGHVRHKQRELTRASLRALFHRLKNPRRGRRAVGDDQNTSGLRDSHAAPFRLLRSEQNVRPTLADHPEHHNPPFPSRRRLLTEDRRRSYASTDPACRRRCRRTDLLPNKPRDTAASAWMRKPKSSAPERTSQIQKRNTQQPEARNQ